MDYLEYILSNKLSGKLALVVLLGGEGILSISQSCIWLWVLYLKIQITIVHMLILKILEIL